MLSLFPTKRKVEARAGEIYCPIVARARHPGLYRELGVADTLDGRFEMLVLHVVVLLRRLKALGEDQLAQAVIDFMFADLDQALREMGVGDITVAKKIRPMAEAYAGRAKAYEDALGADAGQGLLAGALCRNVFPDADAAGGDADGLAAYVRALEEALESMSLDDIKASSAPWPEPAPRP